MTGLSLLRLVLICISIKCNLFFVQAMTWLEFANLSAVVIFYVVCICIYVIRMGRAWRKKNKEDNLVVQEEMTNTAVAPENEEH